MGLGLVGSLGSDNPCAKCCEELVASDRGVCLAALSNAPAGWQAPRCRPFVISTNGNMPRIPLEAWVGMARGDLSRPASLPVTCNHKYECLGCPQCWQQRKLEGISERRCPGDPGNLTKQYMRDESPSRWRCGDRTDSIQMLAPILARHWRRSMI